MSISDEEINRDQSEASLRDAYAVSSRKLREHFLGPCNSKREAQGSPTDKHKYYEKLLCGSRYEEGRLNEILEAVTVHLSRQGSAFSVGRAIVHLNSFHTGTRIRIPFHGDPARGAKSAEWQVWRDRILSGNDRKWIFGQPDRPSHLLTELMWRLQNREKWGQGYAMGLFSKEDELYNLVKDNSEVAFSVCLSKGDSLRGGSAHEYFGYEAEDDLYEHLRKSFDEKRVQIGDKAEVPFPTGRKYEPKEMKDDLCKNPVDKFFISAKENWPAIHNIFYQSDISETEYLGGIDFEVAYEKNDRFTPEELKRFLRTVQWTISQYVIRLVVDVERNYALPGDTYRNKFFSGQGCNQLIKMLGRIASSADYDTQKVMKRIEDHFFVVGSPRGNYWRGYPRYAFEVACRVADVFHCLFPSLGLEALGNTIRTCGPTLKGLDAKLKRYPFLIQQLFRCLESERQLFHVPLYRDHFVHSFHVFVLGAILLAKRPERIMPSTLTFNIQTLCSWFLVAMWHDVAYSLEKIDGLAEVTVRRLWGEASIKRHTGIMPLNPSLGHLEQINNLRFKTIVTGAANRAFDIKGAGGVEAKDIITAVGMDKREHGIWSAIMLYHGLNQTDRSDFRRKLLETIEPQADSSEEGKQKAEKVEADIIAAIMPHHGYDWHVESLTKNFGKWDDKDRKYKPHKGRMRISINRETNPLGCLLVLADMLSQMGREAPEIAGTLDSDIGIRLKQLKIINRAIVQSRTLSVMFAYDKPIDIETLRTFYENPLKYVQLHVTHTKQTDGLRICLADGTPICGVEKKEKKNRKKP